MTSRAGGLPPSFVESAHLVFALGARGGDDAGSYVISCFLTCLKTIRRILDLIRLYFRPKTSSGSRLLVYDEAIWTK